MTADPTDLLTESLESRDGLLLVVTGAGVSLASGIPTFRGTDAGAIWKRDVLEMATFAFFEEDPVESWRWYTSRFDSLRRARPNPAHHALAAIERWCAERRRSFLLITQNIDTLHEQAGSEKLIKIHGSSDRVRCPARGCRLGAPHGTLPASWEHYAPFLDRPCLEHLPRCPECESILRPHVLWFDEFYNEHVDYQWDRVLGAAAVADTVLFVGTSFSVGATDAIVQYASTRRADLLSIDPGATTPPYRGIVSLPEAAETLLPRVCERLGTDLGDRSVG